MRHYAWYAPLWIAIIIGAIYGRRWWNTVLDDIMATKIDDTWYLTKWWYPKP